MFIQNWNKYFLKDTCDFKLKGRDVLRVRYLPSVTPCRKPVITFFLFSQKMFWVRQNIQFVYFPKHFVSLSVSHEISSHLAKNMLFLRKRSIFFAKCDEILLETDKLTKYFGKWTN